MVEPGWYPDPEAKNSRRYWDGERWTEHVAPHDREDEGLVFWMMVLLAVMGTAVLLLVLLGVF